jgi:sugar (pentulose or hexulose) kinase
MIAVFDVGKTNKKLFVFNDELKIVYEKSQQIPEIQDEDGFPCEDIQVLTAWMQDAMANLLQEPAYDIRKINFSGYGASWVHLGRDGKPVAPLYNYLKPFPESLKEKFHNNFGTEELVALKTASPPLGNLNSGMQLYWLMHERPELYKNIAVSLHLPQYLASIFSGRYFSDITSIGCHTRLWNFQENRYHAWVMNEKIDNKLAPLCHFDLVMPVPIQGKTIEVGIGIHDSSAALIPYLKHFSEPFILISTGTWCISLNPFNHDPLTIDELRQDCLCYMSYQGNPVKASRLFSGHEHEVETKRLSQRFHKTEDYYQSVKYNGQLLSSIPYEHEHLDQFHTFEQAYHALIQMLIKKQIFSTGLIIGKDVIKSIFVDGGFSKNEIFMQLLADGFRNQQVFSSEVAQASALGALLCVNPESEKYLSKNFTSKYYQPQHDTVLR